MKIKTVSPKKSAAQRKKASASKSRSFLSLDPGFVRLVVLAIAIVAIGGFSFIASCKLGRSSAASLPVTVVSNLNYGPSQLDLYYSGTKTGPLRSAIVLVHGGGWVGGDKTGSDIVTPANDLAEAGFVVFDINYPLASSTVAGYPMQIQAVTAAVNYVKAHSSTFYVNPNKIGLLGGSAGANLVDMTGLTMNNTAPGSVGAVVSLSAPTELWNLYAQGATQILNGTITTQEKTSYNNLRDYLGCPNSTCSQTTANAASPIDNINAHCPPTGIINSQNEMIPVSQATDFSSNLSAAGCTAQLQILPGSLHAFAYWSTVKDGVINFFNTYLN